MKNVNNKILMIFIEPTPYILGLIERGFSITDELDVVFLSENVSQSWNLKSYQRIYPIIKSKKQLLSLFINIFFKRKYRLIHLAGWSNKFILFVIILSRLFFIPAIVESDTILCLDIPLWKRIIKRCFYPILFKLPVFFLPGGTRQAQYLAHYSVAHKKMMKAQMTVDVDDIKNKIGKISLSERNQLRLLNQSNQEDVIFLFVGRLLDWKGIRELIAAIAMITDPRAKLWIVGSGELQNEVKSAAMHSKKITYFGRVEGDRLWEIYFAADVFVIPSHSEPWGLVVNEAMAVGLPVIATQRVGCIDDLILNKNTGLIIEQKNSIAIHEAMSFMLNSSKIRKEMAKKASEHAATWTLKNEASNIIKAWKKSGWSGNVYS